MKTPTLFVAVAGLILTVSFAAVAQSGAASDSAEANAIADRYMTSVQAELTSKVDTKNATVGQEVTAKTVDSARLADGTNLPKGTKLVGHVTQVQARTKDDAGAILALSFDRAELKGGQTLPVRTMIRAVGPTSYAGANMNDSAMTGMMTPPVAASPSAGGRGGTLGGGTRSAGQTTRSAVGAVGATTQNPGMVLGSVGQTGVRPVVQAGENVSGVTQATGLPGVMLSTQRSGEVSGVLSAAGQNISLGSGIQITLGVIGR